MARVFVTGGSGLLGGVLVTALRARGEEVVALARSDAAAAAMRARGALPVRAELLDEAGLAEAMRGCALVFHLAGINTLCPDDPVPLYEANVRGAETVVRAAARAGIARVVHTSSAAVLGETQGTIGREDTPHRGSYLSDYERSKALGEAAALAAGRAAGVEVVCVNPTSVQGPGRTSGTGRFLLLHLAGRLPAFVATRLSLVDIDDCVEGHLLAARRGRPGERYVLAGATLTTGEAIALLEDVAGPSPRRPRLVPRPTALAAAAALEAGFRLVRRPPPVCRAMVRTLLHGHAYDGSKATRELGLQYTPVRETFRRTADWARREGLVPG